MTALGTLHILIVDDNVNMRSILTAMMKSVGVGRISEAETSERAWNILHETSVDIALIDFRMGPMDGVTLTRHLRDESRSPNPFLPIIMMTGHSERYRVTEARDAGVTEFVAKPVVVVDLLRRIESIILRPRAFVRSETYFGPDRRRTIAVDYEGPYRRVTDFQR